MEENKELDDFIRKSVNQVGLEKPSVDFTNLVISKINANVARSSVFVHQPLFSTTTWFIIAAIVVAIFAYVIFGQTGQESTWNSIFQLNKLASFNLMGSIPKIPVSNTIFYGVLSVAFFGCLQIIVLKKRVDNAYKLN
jgi:hypothetical protein